MIWRRRIHTTRLFMYNGAPEVIWQSQSAPHIAPSLACNRVKLSPNPGQSFPWLYLKEVLALVLVPFPSRCLEVDRRDLVYLNPRLAVEMRTVSRPSRQLGLPQSPRRVPGHLLYRRRSWRVLSALRTGVSLLPLSSEGMWSFRLPQAPLPSRPHLLRLVRGTLLAVRRYPRVTHLHRVAGTLAAVPGAVL
jgi:hypothetical protein